jgi:hypothetical protein
MLSYMLLAFHSWDIYAICHFCFADAETQPRWATVSTATRRHFSAEASTRYTISCRNFCQLIGLLLSLSITITFSSALLAGHWCRQIFLYRHQPSAPGFRRFASGTRMHLARLAMAADYHGRARYRQRAAAVASVFAAAASCWSRPALQEPARLVSLPPVLKNYAGWRFFAFSSSSADDALPYRQRFRRCLRFEWVILRLPSLLAPYIFIARLRIL